MVSNVAADCFYCFFLLFYQVQVYVNTLDLVFVNGCDLQSVNAHICIFFLHVYLCACVWVGVHALGLMHFMHPCRRLSVSA